MLISHKYKFIFIKARKVSGTSTEAFLERYCLSDDEEKTHVHSNERQELVSDFGVIGSRGVKPRPIWFGHKKPDDIKNEIGAEIWDSYSKICNIRNPYDIAVSHYYFVNRKNPNFTPSIYNFESHLNEKLPNLLDNKKFWMSDGVFFHDFYLRQENLKSDLDNLINQLNLPSYESELPTYKMVANRPHYSSFYNKKTKRIIKNNFGDVIERFEYSF